jgi:hypothetical protein
VTTSTASKHRDEDAAELLLLFHGEFEAMFSGQMAQAVVDSLGLSVAGEVRPRGKYSPPRVLRQLLFELIEASDVVLLPN